MMWHFGVPCTGSDRLFLQLKNQDKKKQKFVVTNVDVIK